MKKWTTLIIIIIAIAASAGGIYAYRTMTAEEEEEKELRVEWGDQVTVHYTGWLEDDRIYDTRRIFDTSRDRIPEDTTLTFDDRARGDPFQFTVGEGVIDGWSESVVGMREGQTIDVRIPPEKAYDTRTEDLLFSVEKEEQLPVYHSMSVVRFENTYGTQPSPNMVVTHQFWGWDVTVVSVEGNVALLRNEPDLGQKYYAYIPEEGADWVSRVTSIDSSAHGGTGEIIIRNDVKRGIVMDGEHIARHHEEFADIDGIRRNAGQSGGYQGIVVDVGEEILMDFNEEVAGRTLRFRITVLEIQR